MASPVGHTLAGWIGYLAVDGRPVAQGWRTLILCAAAANLADADFLPGILLGVADRFHHGASHSLGAALLVGLAAWFRLRCEPRGGREALVVGALHLSHVLIDWITRDTRPPVGMPLFWPLSERYFAPVLTIFFDIRRESGAGWETLAHNLRAVALETAWLAPLGAGLLAWRRHQRRGLAA
jgi:inner membrane protein